MESIILMDPCRCRMWRMHDRLEDQICEDSCSDLIESFAEHGQLVPVLGRKLGGDADHDVELIFGARRLFAARHLKRKLLIELREMTDQEAIVAMDIENRQRKDVSPYERGLSYARWLRNKYFASQDELARSLQISASQVSRFLSLSKLPSVIIDSFDSALHIREGWGLALADILDDPVKRNLVIAAARSIGTMTPRPPAKDVYKQLLTSATAGGNVKEVDRDHVIKGTNGTPLFRVKHQRSSIALVLPVERTSAKSLNAIQNAVAEILQRHRKASVVGDKATELQRADR